MSQVKEQNKTTEKKKTPKLTGDKQSSRYRVQNAGYKDAQLT